MSLVIAIEAQDPIAAELRALLGEHVQCVSLDAPKLDCRLLVHAPPAHDSLKILAASCATRGIPEQPVVVVTRDEGRHFRLAALAAGAMECVAFANLSCQCLLGAIEDAIERFALFRRSAAFRATFENAAIGLAHVALDGRFLAANGALCKLTGYTLEELRSKTFSDITHPEDLKSDWDQAHRLLSGDISSYSMEKRYLRKGGSEVWIRLNGALARDEHGLPFFIAVIEDIDARKATEREHRKLLELAEHSCDFISTADLDGHLTYLNPGGREMIGLPAETDIRRVHLTDYVAAPWRAFCENTLLPTVRKQGMWSGEMQFVNLRGEQVDVSRLSFLLRDPDTGKPWCIATVARDIGDRKRAERALAEADERLRAQLSASDVGLWNWDARQNRVNVDPNLIRLFGLSADDDPADLNVYLARIHPEDRERVGTNILNSVQSGASYDQVYRVLRPEGGVRWIHARGLIERDPSGRPLSFPGIALDVSERYETEARLRESESILRSLYESSVFMMGVVEIPDDDSDILHIYDSPATYRFFGVAPGSMDRKWSSEIGVPSAVSARWIATYRESEREKRAVRFEYEHPGPSGPSSLVSVVTCIGRAPHGGTRFSYVTEDVTERKRSEQRLRDRDIHLGLAMAASLTIAFDWDIRSNRVWRPRSVEQALPETGEDWDTFEGVASVVHPDDRELFHANIREALRSSSGKYRSEHRIVRQDGEIRWLFETGTVEFDADRNPVRLLGVSQDVSDRRQEQETLQRQAQLIDISYEPIMLWTRDRGILEWNWGAERLYGFTKAEALGESVHELLQTRS
ncbi:MAG TPA: PAS domain S-box protein, partial [Polyangiaceae bacterium]|nr:PAS domain S-box protein [Polyangiaceae bacterium]